MSILEVSSESAKMQQPVTISKRIKENTASEETKESQAQKAAEQQKAEAAKTLSPSPKGVGQTVNRKA
jgi:hypothetical protein